MEELENEPSYDPEAVVESVTIFDIEFVNTRKQPNSRFRNSIQSTLHGHYNLSDMHAFRFAFFDELRSGPISEISSDEAQEKEAFGAVTAKLKVLNIRSLEVSGPVID